MVTGVGSMEVEEPGGGVGLGFVGRVGPVSTAAFSWVEGALNAVSSSESSELRWFEGASVIMGRIGGLVVDSGAEFPILSRSVTLCFFFGCGSSVGWDRCLERAGTGMVARVVARGNSGTSRPHLGLAGVGMDCWSPFLR